MSIEDILNERNSDIEASNTEILARLERLQKEAKQAEKEKTTSEVTPETETLVSFASSENPVEE